MVAHLAVQIEHRDLVRVLEIERESQGSLDLTTMRQDQRKAVIEIFLVDGPDQRMVASFVVPSLPQIEGRKPLIQLRGAVEGRKARLRLFVENRLVDTQEVDVRKALPGRGTLPVVVGAIVLLLLAGGAYLLFFRDAGGPEPPAESLSRVESQTRIAPPAPEPSTPELSTPEPGPSTAPGNAAPTPQPTPAPSEAPVREQPQAPAPATPAPSAQTPPGDTSSPDSVAFEPRYVVYFQPNSAVLTPAAQEELSRVRQGLEGEPAGRLRIVGHTALAGNEAGRIELSWDRARAVQAYLSEAGLEAVDQAQIIGRGGEEPVARETELQHLNRRVEIYLGA
jgi:outer membrane protein OmpA-like peptidoglycan-associated protein